MGRPHRERSEQSPAEGRRVARPAAEFPAAAGAPAQAPRASPRTGEAKRSPAGVPAPGAVVLRPESAAAAETLRSVTG